MVAIALFFNYTFNKFIYSHQIILNVVISLKINLNPIFVTMGRVKWTVYELVWAYLNSWLYFKSDQSYIELFQLPQLINSLNWSKVAFLISRLSAFSQQFISRTLPLNSLLNSTIPFSALNVQNNANCVRWQIFTFKVFLILSTELHGSGHVFAASNL